MNPEVRDKLNRKLREFEVAATQVGHDWYSQTSCEPWERKMEQARRDLLDVVEDALTEAEHAERSAS